ncbi:MAG: DUF86 domain-containing protein [Planctomycetes bacterium]|nr:DUF86 domain-containing protein [Planctomycetota bacterium]
MRRRPAAVGEARRPRPRHRATAVRRTHVADRDPGDARCRVRHRRGPDSRGAGRHQQVFERLCAAGWLTPGQRDTCRRMVAFRNVVVHRYLRVDPRIVRSIVERDLGDLLAFVAAVEERLRRG